VLDRIDTLHTAFPSTGGAGAGDNPRSTTSRASRDADGDQALTDSEKQQVQKLKQRDREVRAHERAHMAAGAGLVRGGASFSMQRGPDGRMYAVGGEVSIDTSAENDPDATIRKMQQVKRAALAPAQPSGTDRAVAAQAGQIESQARQEKNSLENDALAADNTDRLAGEGGPTASARRPYDTEALGKALNVVA
jgi:hypothetical protein